MLDDKLQFAISQYVDGALSAEEAAQIDDRMARDPEVRALVEEYRHLDSLLRQASAAPEVDWNDMAQRISAAVDAGSGQAAIPISEGKPSWGWWRPLAVAAGLLICATIAVMAWRQANPGEVPDGGVLAHSDPGETATVRTAEGYAIVNVLTPEAAPNRGDIHVRIGEASHQGVLIAMGADYADLTARGQSRVLISSLPVHPLPDDELGLLH